MLRQVDMLHAAVHEYGTRRPGHKVDDKNSEVWADGGDVRHGLDRIGANSAASPTTMNIAWLTIGGPASTQFQIDAILNFGPNMAFWDARNLAMSSLNYILAIGLAVSFLLNFIRGILDQRRKVTLLEAKVQYLFEKTGVAYEPIPVLTPAIRKAVAEGKKIEAIKLYRDATGSSLQTAKDAIEQIMS